jgi:exopolysaccharide biosynthesis protein
LFICFFFSNQKNVTSLLFFFIYLSTRVCFFFSPFFLQFKKKQYLFFSLFGFSKKVRIKDKLFLRVFQFEIFFFFSSTSLFSSSTLQRFRKKKTLMKILSALLLLVLALINTTSVFIFANQDKTSIKNYPSWLLRTNDDNGNSSSNVPNINIVKQIDFNNTTAHVMTLKNARSGNWHIYCHGCSSMHKCNEESREFVSVQAQQRNCTSATNASPFSYKLGAGCNGYVISDGILMGNSGPSGGINPTGAGCLGITKDHNHWWFGEDGAAKDVLNELDQLVCGFNFLVVDGKPQYSHATEIAPRTAWGISEEGNLISLVADGAETIKTGLTLNSTVDWMIKLGAKYAVNMDGGGSATMVNSEFQVLGCPSCVDTPKCCERAVITIQCIKP